MPTVNAYGIDLYYEVHGDGAPILGIHGTPSSALLWVDAAEELAGCGRCIIYERRGFPRSKAPEPFDSVDLTDHVEDAAALLEALYALVLLEPAVLTADPEAPVWAEQLRRTVLRAAAENPVSAAQAVIGEALGDAKWESFPAELKELFTASSPAVLAEIRGKGLSVDDLVDVTQMSA